MILVTWNVNSIRARLEHVLRYADERRPDILCLQELKVQEEAFPVEPFERRGYAAAVAGQPGYNGVALIAASGITDRTDGFPQLNRDHPLNAQRRVVAATVGGVRVVSVYAPNGEAVGSERFAYKLAFFRALREYFDRELSPQSLVCVAGDLNVAPEPRDVHDPWAWEGQVLYSEPERSALENLRAFGFEDCFRRHQAGEGLYTWWDYRGGAFWRERGLRIDHIWATRALAERCVACEIDVFPRKWKRPSDHAPVRAEFTL